LKQSLQAAPPGRRLTVVLALLTTLGPYSIDAFFPSMRAIAAYFDVSYFTVQQTLTAYMLPFALMSLVHGSLSDSIGRRPVVLGGLFVYAVAATGCALAPSFGWMLAFRALQGAVAGVGMIISRTVVRDRYSGPQAQRVMSAITMVFALGPALAPVVGGWVHVWFGWRAVFFTMTVFALLLALLVLRFLPETLPPAQRTPLRLGPIVRNTLAVMGHGEFLRLTAASSLCFVALQAYIGSAPAVILDHWHGTETGFAMLTIPIIGGYSIGAFASGRLAGRLPPERQANYGYAVLLAMTGMMLLLQWLWPAAPVLLQQLLLACTTFGLQLMFPVVTLRILDLFSHSRGATASANSFFSLLVSTLTMGTFAPWLSQSMLRLAACAFLANVAGWLMWRTAIRHRSAHVAA
jgi:DHA1 family bicyclomycin/chloramphenicol resistance-like MFS transporter